MNLRYLGLLQDLPIFNNSNKWYKNKSLQNERKLTRKSFKILYTYRKINRKKTRPPIFKIFGVNPLMCPYFRHWKFHNEKLCTTCPKREEKIGFY